MTLKLKKYSKISFSFSLSRNKYIHLLNSRVNKNDNLQYCKVMALQSFNDRKEKRKEKCTKNYFFGNFLFFDKILLLPFEYDVHKL